MITLKTDCNKCTHADVCRYKDNSANDMNKLKNMTYGNGSNDDYNWDIMSESRHVKITFECPDYTETPSIFCR